MFQRSVRRSRRKSILKGFGIGLIGGFTLGLIEGDDPPGTIMALSASEKGLLVGLGLGHIGAVVGAMRPVERWEAVNPGDLRLSVAPTDGGARMSLTFGFAGRKHRDGN